MDSNKKGDATIDKLKDKLLMFCNECNWKEKTIGLKYDFCPKCGHVNIGFSKIKDALNKSMK